MRRLHPFVLRYGERNGYVVLDAGQKMIVFRSPSKTAAIAECQRRNGFVPIDGDEETYAKQTRGVFSLPRRSP